MSIVLLVKLGWRTWVSFAATKLADTPLNETHTPGHWHLDHHSGELHCQVHCQVGSADRTAPSMRAWEALGHVVCFS